MGLPELNQYLARINVSCSRTQHSDAGDARTHGPSVKSQALYHWATAFPYHSITDKTKILMTIGSLRKAKSIAECWSILQYFWPALSDNWSRKPIFDFRSFWEWLFNTGFTVPSFEIILDQDHLTSSGASWSGTTHIHSKDQPILTLSTLGNFSWFFVICRFFQILFFFFFFKYSFRNNISASNSLDPDLGPDCL